MRAGVLTAVFAVIFALPSGGPAEAAQQQNAWVHVYWAQQGWSGVTEVDQDIAVAQTAPQTFWAGDWTWSGQSQGGYLGLQHDAGTVNGVGGDIAIFSLWNATNAAGANCAPFAGEGQGEECRVAFPIVPGRYYTYRVLPVPTSAPGQWWAGQLVDTQTSQTTAVGMIQAPAPSETIGGYVNFTEYFGDAVPTPSDVPESIAQFTQPAANPLGGGTYQYVGSYQSSEIGPGTTGHVTLDHLDDLQTNAAQVTMGSRSPAPIPSPTSPCTKKALTSATRHAREGFVRRGHIPARDYGCAGRYAWAGEVVGPRAHRVEITVLFHTAGRGWKVVPRETPCRRHQVPARIYRAACESN